MNKRKDYHSEIQLYNVQNPARIQRHINQEKFLSTNDLFSTDNMCMKYNVLKNVSEGVTSLVDQ
jgi:hypothetical protein